MAIDTSVLLVNSILIVGIVVALFFGVVLGRMNRQLEQQNREAREQLDREMQLLQ